MSKNIFLPALQKYFEEYLPSTQGASSNTVRSYMYAFKLLFEFLMVFKGVSPNKVRFETLSHTVLKEYFTYLEQERHCSVKTRNIRRAALLSFASYSSRMNYPFAIKFYTEMMKIPKKREPKEAGIKYFTQEEIKIVLSMPNTATDTGRRDTVLLSVLYATGARAQELCDIRVKDVRFDSPARIKLTGKGNKSRIVTIPDSCAAVLKGYMKSKGFMLSDPAMQERHLFSSRTNEHMTISCVEGIVKKYVKEAKDTYRDYFKQSSYSPHTFRHSIAVHMLEAGDSLITIKAFLGHASIASTTIYAQVTPELANKYLDERGKPIDTDMVSCEPQPLAQMLPFLYGHR